MKKFGFPKKERLHLKSEITAVFSQGKSINVYPYRILISTPIANGDDVKVLISIPKRKIKKATSRNRIKRQTKEAYRKNKFLLTSFAQENNLGLIIAFIYNESTTISYSIIEEKVIHSLNTITKTIDKTKMK